MRVFSDLNLNGQTPLRAQPGAAEWGPLEVHGTRWKKWQRVVVPVVAVVAATALFFLGRYFYLALTGA